MKCTLSFPHKKGWEDYEETKKKKRRREGEEEAVMVDLYLATTIPPGVLVDSRNKRARWRL